MMDYVDDSFLNNPAIKKIRVCSGLGVKKANKNSMWKSKIRQDLKNQNSF